MLVVEELFTGDIMFWKPHGAGGDLGRVFTAERTGAKAVWLRERAWCTQGPVKR